MSTVIRASESGHWYTRDGVPQYTVEAKKGGQRATTLRDARTMNLVPSVTTILGVAAKPALLAWMQQQVLMAALTLPKVDSETEEQYIARIIHDSKSKGVRLRTLEQTSMHQYKGTMKVIQQENTTRVLRPAYKRSTTTSVTGAGYRSVHSHTTSVLAVSATYLSLPMNEVMASSLTLRQKNSLTPQRLRATTSI